MGGASDDASVDLDGSPAVADEAAIAEWEAHAAVEAGMTDEELVWPFDEDTVVYIEEAGGVGFARDLHGLYAVVRRWTKRKRRRGYVPLYVIDGTKTSVHWSHIVIVDNPSMEARVHTAIAQHKR